MLEKYIDKIKLRSEIITKSIESFCDHYQKKENIIEFFILLLELLKEDNFLVLDFSLIEKIRDICISLNFYFPEDYSIKYYRKEILKILKKQEIKFKKEKEKIVQKLVEMEKEERKIPECYYVGKEEILEMYKRDCENYNAIVYRVVEFQKLSLLHYLTTVNKFYTIFPDFINTKTNKTTILFSISKLRNHTLWYEELETYIQETEKRILRETKMPKKVKIIEFPK